MIEQRRLPDSPLSHQDLEKIEATKLPSLARHHLRLLAHCLACFKDISIGKERGPLPSQEKTLTWCMNQPSLKNDEIFIKNMNENKQESILINDIVSYFESE